MRSFQRRRLPQSSPFPLPPSWHAVSTLEVRWFFPWALLSMMFSQPLSIFAGLPPDVRSEEVSKFFDGYGRIVDCRVMTGL